MAGGSDSSTRSTIRPRRAVKGAPAPQKSGAPQARAKPAAAKSVEGKSSRERRTQQRVRARTFAKGGIAGDATRKAAAFLCTTINLSVGGCLIRTYEAIESGMTVTLALKLPEGDISVQGMIVHVNEDAIGCKMGGVRFAPLDADAHTKIIQHIASYGVDEDAPAEEAPGAKGGGAPERASRKFVVEGRIHRK
jgi:hypothetical protein